MEQYLTEVFGDKNASSWFASFTFILMGVIISMGIVVSNRNKNKVDTPYKFNWKFLFQDNLIRFIASLFICFAIVRFGETYTGEELILPACLSLGLVSDQLLIFAEKWQNKARKKFNK